MEVFTIVCQMHAKVAMLLVRRAQKKEFMDVKVVITELFYKGKQDLQIVIVRVQLDIILIIHERFVLVVIQLV